METSQVGHKGQVPVAEEGEDHSLSHIDNKEK
jgi:hypothetical protein